jgi:Ca-activated chloride channel homolog
MSNFVLFFLSCFVALAPAMAASTDSPSGPLPESVRAPRPAASVAPSIRVETDLTLVPVTVTDSHGRSVRGLNQRNFRVYDESEQRPIVAFSREDAPVSVGLIFDASRSMRDKIQAAREASSQLFHELNAEDEVFLITVSDRASLRQDFTSFLGDVSDALVFAGPGGSTSLLDGVFLGLEHIKKARNPRKALVVVSDGGDNNSRYTLRELAGRAVEADTSIYTVCLFQRPQTQEEVDGPDLLQSLAEKTGGIPFLSKTLENFGNIMRMIGVALHNQYVLGYHPPDNAPSGKYRKIKVQLLVPPGSPPMQVYARAGYYVPAR